MEAILLLKVLRNLGFFYLHKKNHTIKFPTYPESFKNIKAHECPREPTTAVWMILFDGLERRQEREDKLLRTSLFWRRCKSRAAKQVTRAHEVQVKVRQWGVAAVVTPWDVAAVLMVGRQDTNESCPGGCTLPPAQEVHIHLISVEALTSDFIY